MSNKLLKRIAYILIVSSFLFFALASYIAINEKKMSSTKQIVAGDISITEKPTEELIEENDDSINNTTEDTKTETNKANNTKDNKANNSKSNNSNTTTGAIINNNNNNTINNNTSPKTNSSTPTPTYVDPNNQLRVNIENQYNVNIIYGTETNGYIVGGMSTIAISDQNRIANALNSLRTCLSRYPSNLFNEIHAVYPLNIYLIDRYSTPNVTGVTDSSNRTVNVSIATAYPFDVSLHHELYHYIEHYMFARGASFNTWNSLNPSGFNYGNVNTNLAYSRTLSPDAYFVNEYAMYSDAEDRASTFEYMTSGSKASCLNSGKPVNLKAKYMAQTMEYYINSVSPSVTEYWERFL